MTRLHRISYFFLLPLLGAAAALGIHSLLLGQPEGEARAIPQSARSVTIDGHLDDPFWEEMPAHRLRPSEGGVPGQWGGLVRMGVRGQHLILAARLPEPGGKVLARSIGRNPVWEKDAIESPPVEDRIRFVLSSSGGDRQQLTLEVNPWGAYRVEANGEAISTVIVQPAAVVSPEGWSVEASMPLEDVGFSVGGKLTDLRLSARRIRSRRPLAPEFQWAWPSSNTDSPLRLPASESLEESTKPPRYRPPALGNTEPALEVGRVAKVPPLEADWDHAAWKNVRAFELPRNEPNPRSPRHPTKVKWVHDGRTLALLVKLVEPEPVVADSGGRDARVDGDDHFAIYLATSGSKFLEVITNSVGAIRDSLGSGPHNIRPSSSWNADIEVITEIQHGEWVARIDLPLDQFAEALGDEGIPGDWRVVLSRRRAPRPGEPAEVSALPPVGASTFYGPVRYRRLVLRDEAPSEVAMPGKYRESPEPGTLAAELASLDARVWSRLERNAARVRSMLRRHSRQRAEEAILAERRDWEKVKTRKHWERFRDARLAALHEAVGEIPAARPPLDVRITARHRGNGYRLHNLVYQSRAGFYVAANLYLPEEPAPPMPAIIILHSHHYPRTQGELHDMGQLWARTGTAVLLVERLGFGERVETTPWYRQAYASRFTFKKQLGLVGETRMGWMAWDLIRAVDLLYERPDIDRDRITLIGSVAGGGEPAGVAAALDPRIDAVVPYNYDQGHVRLDADFFGEISRQISPWLVVASRAPKRYVRAFEFGWEGAEQPQFPHLWFDGWRRSQKVWGFYGRKDHLASAQGYGLIRLSMERVSHCYSIGPQQRRDLFPIFRRWFDIPLPRPEDRNMLPDSGLSKNPWREQARKQEAQRRRPHADLLCIPPSESARLNRRPLHAIARGMGKQRLGGARKARQDLPPEQKRRRLRQHLAQKLGDVEPNRSPKAETLWKRSLTGAQVEAIVLDVEDGIQVPLLFIQSADGNSDDVVVGIARAGKGRFLSDRAEQIQRLIESGAAVCLPDLRGTGETAPDEGFGDFSAQRGRSEMEFDLGNTLMGARLKDLRTVLAYLREQVGANRISVWGESFAPENPKHLYVDELRYEAGPQMQFEARPHGAHLALLAALYDGDIHAVAATGGLASFLSVLDDPFTYVPTDATVPGLLEVADIADIAAAAAPRPLLLQRFVNGRNVRVREVALSRDLRLAREAYAAGQASKSLTLRADPADAAEWLLRQF